MSESIYRTIYQVEVFSRGPFIIADGDEYDSFDLSAINYAITEGDCIGNVEQVASTVVPANKLRETLRRIGNDGGFFEEDDDA